MLNKIKNYINDTNFKITIFDNYININNYEEIIVLEEECIIIRLISKLVTIKGNNLFIKKLLDKEILIKGFIKEVIFNEI